MTRSRSSSSAASRRSSPVRRRPGPSRRAAAAVLLLAPFAAAAAAAASPAPSRAVPSLAVTAERAPGRVTAGLRFSWSARDDLARSLEQGLASRLVFTARLYDRRPGFLGLFRDRLVAQATVVRRAWRDSLTQEFMVEDNGAADRSYPSAAALIDAFFTVQALPLAAAGAEHPVVSARARLEPLLLEPPLTLLTLFGSAAVGETGWVRAEPAPADVGTAGARP